MISVDVAGVPVTVHLHVQPLVARLHHLAHARPHSGKWHDRVCHRGRHWMHFCELGYGTSTVVMNYSRMGGGM